MSCGTALPPAPDDTGELPAVRADGVPDHTVALDALGPAAAAGGTAQATAAQPVVDRTTALPPAEVRGCPACGAANSASRVLCGRCGADLDTGRAASTSAVVHQPGPAAPVVGDVSRAEPSSSGRTAWVIAAIVVIGAAVGVAVGLAVAGGGDAEQAPAAVFDEAVYTGEPEALTVAAVGASSTRPGAGDAGYDAANLVDGDPTTSWSHDPAVEPVTDVDLAIVLTDPAWVTAITFANGAQVDDPAFAADGRVRRLGLVVDGVRVAELELLDQTGLQQVTLPSPQLVTELRLVVLDAVAGATYDEVSLSEIELVGHPAVGQDLSRMIAG